MSIAADVFSQALGLPALQREELALLLWESLPDDDDHPLALDPEYEAEVLRRVEKVGSGQAKTLTLQEVMARLRKSPRLTTQNE